MKIYCKNYNPPMQVNQKVNQIGRFIGRNVDGIVRTLKSGNMYDVWFKVLYEIPDKGPLYKKVSDEVFEMIININITTYQNKLRVNVIGPPPDDKTIGHAVFKPELIEDVNEAKNLIMDKVKIFIEKEFKDYDFIF